MYVLFVLLTSTSHKQAFSTVIWNERSIQIAFWSGTMQKRKAPGSLLLPFILVSPKFYNLVLQKGEKKAYLYWILVGIFERIECSYLLYFESVVAVKCYKNCMHGTLTLKQRFLRPHSNNNGLSNHKVWNALSKETEKKSC